MTVVVQARNLRKQFGKFEAVRGIDFAIERGKCIGLLGPNGAGKTTTMRMMTGLTQPSAGEIDVFGELPWKMSRKTRTRIGLVPQEDNLDPDVSVRENLLIYGKYFGLSGTELEARTDQLLAFMQLTEKADMTVMALSGGMKRRLVIARALIADPELIILDEPTTGLDPQARQMIWKKLQALKAAGKTLLLTTHYMDEAQRLCDKIIVIDQGRILDQDTPAALVAKHVEPHVIELPHPLPKVLEKTTLRHEALGDSTIFYVADAQHFLRALPKEQVYFHRPSNLEDVFICLTGRQLRD